MLCCVGSRSRRSPPCLSPHHSPVSFPGRRRCRSPVAIEVSDDPSSSSIQVEVGGMGLREWERRCWATGEELPRRVLSVPALWRSSPRKGRCLSGNGIGSLTSACIAFGQNRWRLQATQLGRTPDERGKASCFLGEPASCCACLTCRTCTSVRLLFS